MNIDIAALDAFLDRKRRMLHLPGMAVGVVLDGRMIYLRGLGVATPGQFMTPQTPLIIGSLSKSITALAVMQLVEASKLVLDESVTHYIPWFRLNDIAASSTITIKHLLTHTSGISRYDGRLLLAGRGGKTIDQSVHELHNLKLSKPVGAAFQYSNINYLIAGLVVEQVSGLSFGAYIQQNIFRPLGMQHSYTSEDDALRGGLAWGVRWWFGLPLPFHAPYLDDALPAAFIAASAQDMAHYMLALLNNGSFAGKTVLSSAGIAALLRPQVAASPNSSYGLGWRVEVLGGESIIRHGGEVSNYLAETVLVPRLGLGVVVLMNANNGLIPLALPQSSRLASSVVRFLLGMSQPKSRISLRGFYALLNTTLAAFSAYQVWSMGRLLSSSARRGRSVLELAALLEVVLSGAAALQIPRWADSPWSLLRLYVPDVTSWLATSFCCSLIKCFVALFRLLRSRR